MIRLVERVFAIRTQASRLFSSSVIQALAHAPSPGWRRPRPESRFQDRITSFVNIGSINPVFCWCCLLPEGSFSVCPKMGQICGREVSYTWCLDEKGGNAEPWDYPGLHSMPAPVTVEQDISIFPDCMIYLRREQKTSHLKTMDRP